MYIPYANSETGGVSYAVNQITILLITETAFIVIKWVVLIVIVPINRGVIKKHWTRPLKSTYNTYKFDADNKLLHIGYKGRLT